MKKIIALALVVIFSLFALVACNGTEDVSDAENADTTVDTSADVVETPTLKMATNAAFPPYEYKEGEAFVGIDVEIATAIAAELGCTLEIVDMEFDSIITSVKQNETDFGMAGMTVTDERKEEVDFTLSYATGVQSVIVGANSEIASIDDLAGKKIGVQLGTTGDIYASGDYGEENVTKYGKGADAVIALKGGDVDAVIIDNEPAKAFVAENEGLKILDTEYAVEDYAIAVNKGNTELLNKINTALEKLTADGTIDGIIAKYIKAE
ncbi:MAG: transporter substrate-binding domain-containing protein [Ruminococcaceae bacterium]|nr:transporter substrate-binding domain-containing protein [Oscillospiraceae bacterium]